MSRIFLRALTTEDLEFTYKWHADYDLYDSFVGPYRYVSPDAEREWLKEKSSYSRDEINLVICLIKNSMPLGLICLREIDWIARRGHLSTIFIGDHAKRSKGYGSEALNLLLKHCFVGLNLNKIWARILNDNQNSVNMFKKCGFQVEGHLRQYTFKNGEFKDVVMLGLCADQYFEQQS